MNNEDQARAEAMWESLKASSRKAQPQIKRRRAASNFSSWLKEYGVELLALVVAVIALIRTF